MEKQPHQEYRDKLANELKEIRNNSNSENSREEARQYLEKIKEQRDEYLKIYLNRIKPKPENLDNNIELLNNYNSSNIDPFSKYKLAKSLSSLNVISFDNWLYDNLYRIRKGELAEEATDLYFKERIFKTLKILESVVGLIDTQEGSFSFDELRDMVYDAIFHHVHNVIQATSDYWSNKEPSSVPNEYLELIKKMLALNAEARERAGQYIRATSPLDDLYSLTKDDDFRKKSTEMKEKAEEYPGGQDWDLYENPEKLQENIKLLVQMVESLKNNPIHKYDYVQAFKESSFS